MSPHHRRWVAAATARRVPLPDPFPQVRLGPGPAYPAPAALDYYQADRAARDFHTVWLLQSSWRQIGAFGHELGHAWATMKLTDRTLRNRAGRITGRPGLRWYWRDWNPLTHYKQPNEENFADAYARLFEHGARTRADRRLLAFLHELQPVARVDSPPGG